jgi:RNA polymerase sigma-70 factor (ECF subfamily)
MPRSTGHVAPAESNPEVIVLLSAERKLVNQALEELPIAYREILILREMEDLSYKEIAHIAGIPIGTVMSRLARAARSCAAWSRPACERLPDMDP